MLQKILLAREDNDRTNYDAIRYSILLNGTAIIHFLFMVIFFLIGIMFMGIYNIAAVIFYITVARVVPNVNTSHYGSIYIIVMIEVLLHSCLATLFVGWDYNFMFYLIAMIPVSYYLAYSVSSLKRKLLYPFITGASVSAGYMIMRGVSYAMPAFVTGIGKSIEVFMAYFNIVIGLAMTFLFSALFAIEVNAMQLKMESEQERLEDEASFDPLTHFLNRRSMDERLNQAHRNALMNDVKYSLIMGDIDHFKEFNDTYGHDCGDYVLQNISRLISAQIRAKDSACRWGGEEFLLLINDDPDIAIEVANRIRAAINDYEFEYEGRKLHVSITLGVCGYYSGAKVKTLIEIADKRLYKGKQNGRNQVVNS